MNKLFLSLAVLAVSFAASTSQAATVHFDSGSAQVRGDHVSNHKHKHKVWVRTHRSHGRLIRGHYVWR